MVFEYCEAGALNELYEGIIGLEYCSFFLSIFLPVFFFFFVVSVSALSYH
jgi:hypothetical protein